MPADNSHSFGYVCKYTPIELLTALGADPQLIDAEARDFEQAESITHANLCSHAKAIIQQADAYDELMLTDCCDSIRCAFDVLEYKRTQSYRFLLDLPHEVKGCSIERFAQNLIELAHDYGAHSGKPFDRAAFIAACKASHDDEQQLSEITEPFFALVGARVSPELLRSIERLVDVPVVNVTCSGNRHIERMPQDIMDAPFEAMMMWYAGALLRMTPCMRMTDISGRRVLTEHPQLKGIIYNTVKFCDYYGFDYENLRASTSVPIVKIESDYSPMPQGQLSTRLEAFTESIGSLSHNDKEHVMAKNASAGQTQTSPVLRVKKDGRYFAGIDSGSTSTNMVVLDKDVNIVATSIVRTGAKAQHGAQAALNDVMSQLDIQLEDFAAITATGYGRFNIPFATDIKTEITCHAKGAYSINPSIRTIVDIGGQDSKVICLDEEGKVCNFIMNDKCAAGTGRFLEAMARTLEVGIDQLSAAGLSWDKDLTISSMCTVFAESEVISLIADNHSESDIVHGLNKSIASRTGSMVTRAKGVAPFMMTGGVARNRGVVEELERKLGSELYITENPDLCGALGAALFVLEDVAAA